MSDEALAKSSAEVKSDYNKFDETHKISTTCNYINSKSGRICFNLSQILRKDSIGHYLIISRTSDVPKINTSAGSSVWIKVDGSTPFKLKTATPGKDYVTSHINVSSMGCYTTRIYDEYVVFLLPFTLIEKIAFAKTVDIEIEGISNSSIETSFNKKNFEVFKEFYNKAKPNVDKDIPELSL
jgi:hypothetical protein